MCATCGITRLHHANQVLQLRDQLVPELEQAGALIHGEANPSA